MATLFSMLFVEPEPWWRVQYCWSLTAAVVDTVDAKMGDQHNRTLQQVQVGAVVEGWRHEMLQTVFPMDFEIITSWLHNRP